MKKSQVSKKNDNSPFYRRVAIFLLFSLFYNAKLAYQSMIIMLACGIAIGRFDSKTFNKKKGRAKYENIIRPNWNYY